MPKDYSVEPLTRQRLAEYARDDDWIRAFLGRGHFVHIATVFERQPFVSESNHILV
jgi:hypothetical protein